MTKIQPVGRKLIIKIVVNKNERDAIAKRAKKAGLSLSGYARMMSLLAVGLDDIQ